MEIAKKLIVIYANQNYLDMTTDASKLHLMPTIRFDIDDSAGVRRIVI